jgi:hypothetical protein
VIPPGLAAFASCLGSGNRDVAILSKSIAFHYSSPRFASASSQIWIECYDYTVTSHEYEQLSCEEKEHFAKCSKCGEIFDRRSLDEVLFHHTDHRHRPDIQYSGSETLD